MPGALIFIDHLPDLPLLPNQVMGRDLVIRAAQPFQRGLGRGHRGIVQNDQVRRKAVPAWAAIRGQVGLNGQPGQLASA